MRIKEDLNNRCQMDNIDQFDNKTKSKEKGQNHNLRQDDN